MKIPQTELGPNRHQGKFEIVAGLEPVEQCAPPLLGLHLHLARRRRRQGAASARGMRAQIVDDIDPGVDVHNGNTSAPSDAEAERTERARGDAGPCADLDVHRSERVGLGREREDADEENRERDRRNPSYFHVGYSEAPPGTAQQAHQARRLQVFEGLRLGQGLLSDFDEWKAKPALATAIQEAMEWA